MQRPKSLRRLALPGYLILSKSGEVRVAAVIVVVVMAQTCRLFLSVKVVGLFAASTPLRAHDSHFAKID